MVLSWQFLVGAALGIYMAAVVVVHSLRVPVRPSSLDGRISPLRIRLFVAFVIAVNVPPLAHSPSSVNAVAFAMFTVVPASVIIVCWLKFRLRLQFRGYRW